MNGRRSEVPVDISVLVCTLNNSRRLRTTLAHLSRCHVPQGLTWEVVVVNHNSQDDTEAVVEGMAGCLPIEYVIETRRGVSYARNRSVEEASGRLLIFTDDDVKPHPEWIEAFWTAYTLSPNGRLWGGPLESEFEGGTPDAELVKYGPPSVQGLKLGEEEVKIAADKMVPFVGANWACPKGAIVAAGGFDVALGLNAGAGVPNIGEETDLMQRLRQAGSEAWYLPSAKIRHIVPKEKVSLGHLTKRRRAAGRYIVRDVPIRRVLPLLRIPPWVARRIVRALGAWMRAKIAKRSQVGEYLELQEALGMAEELKYRYLCRKTAGLPG